MTINALFIIIAIISVLVIYRGWKRGIIGLVYGIGSWIFMLAFVAVANPMLYDYFINSEAIYGAVYDRVYPYVDATVPKLESRVDTPVRMVDRPADFGRAGAEAAMPFDGKQLVYLANGLSDYTDAIQEYLQKNPQAEDGDSVHIDKDALEKSGISIPDNLKDLIPENGVDIPSEVVEKAAEGGGIQIPEQYQGVVDELEKRGVNVSDFVDSINDKLGDAAGNLREAAVMTATEKAAKQILKGLALLVAYLLAKLICLIVRFVLFRLAEIKPIGLLAKIAGVAVAVVEAGLYTWVILFVISMLRMAPIGETLYAQVEENAFLQAMYDYDPLMAVFGGGAEKE